MKLLINDYCIYIINIDVQCLIILLSFLSFNLYIMYS